MFGCTPKPDTVVGTWSAKNPGPPGNSIVYVFLPNGQYTFTEHAAFESIRSHQTAIGTYTVTPTTLTINTSQEDMGIDADVMAAIDAREAKQNPNLHIPQDKGDVPVKIEQPTTTFAYTLTGDQMTLKDISNFTDHGVLYQRQ